MMTRPICYGLEGERDYKATDILGPHRGREWKFAVTGPSGGAPNFCTRLLGEHNVQKITGGHCASY